MRAFVLAAQRGLVRGLEARAVGPGSMRLIIQPLVAVALGVRDGIMDANAGRPPYLFGMLFARERRRELIRDGINHTTKPMAVGIALDMILQWYIFRSVRLYAAVLVGIFLIGLPYGLSRGIANRITRRRYRTRGSVTGRQDD